jgi:glycosyl transferase, family 25
VTGAVLRKYINLARDRVRAEAMTRAFAGRRHSPERFEAVDWRALDARAQASFYTPEFNAQRYFRPLSAGECGCYASHLRIWQELIDSAEPWALVLEDDVEPDSGFDEVLDAIDQLSPQWDMIKLIGRAREKAARTAALTVSHDLIQYRRLPSLTGAYVVSREGARKLLASRMPFGRPIDVDLRWWWENDLTVFGVQPYPVRLAPTSEDSSIGARKGQKSWQTRLGKWGHSLQYNWCVLQHSRSLRQQWLRMNLP